MNIFNQVSRAGMRLHDVSMFPHDFQAGGSVLNRDQNISKRLLPKGDVDVVLARVQPGEIVIPKKYTRKVTKFLKHEKINLPNMK